MTGNVVRAAAAAACLAGLAACIPAYKPPAAGEPAALVKIKVTYDHAQALKVLPASAESPSLALQVQAEVESRAYALATKAWPEALRSPDAAVLDMVPVTLHASKPVVLVVRFAAKWNTTQLETVQETERIPKQVTRTQSSYNSTTKRTEFRTVTVTEYETRTRTVTKPVTRPHEAGCTARVPLRPEKDGVYLVDYSDLALTADCSAAAFRQVLREDGTFELLSAGEHPAPGAAPPAP